jgi:phosphate transport system substrate-binding protein
MTAGRRTVLRGTAALVLAFAGGSGPAQERTEAAGSAAFSGAGSTFAFPVLSAWARAFQRSEATAEYQPVGAALDYEPVGSQAGLMRLREGAVDFAATDVPLAAEDLAQSGFAQFPLVTGGIVVAHNLENVPAGQLQLTGEVLADIFLGKIRSWQDTRVRAANPDLRLPDAPIMVVRRSDGSGTTFNFTRYLSTLSPEWRRLVGEGLTVAWPIGDAAKGNDGVAERIKATRNAIGYVEFAQAQRAGLAAAALPNSGGEFLSPSREAFQAATGTDAERRNAYPLVATAYAVVPRQTAYPRRQQALLGFFDWSFDKGARVASELGYVPLSDGAIAENRAVWERQLGVQAASDEALRRTGRR